MGLARRGQRELKMNHVRPGDQIQKGVERGLPTCATSPSTIILLGATEATAKGQKGGH